MSPTSALDGFFFYLFLPSMTILSILVARIYNQKHDQSNKFTSISSGVMIGNILYSLFSVITVLFMYLYILDLSILKESTWQFLTLASFIFFFLIIGIGLGAHAAGVAFETQLRQHLPKNEYASISQTIHLYHSFLGHKLPFTGLLLISYSLTLLDLFKGQLTIMSNIHLYLSIFSGIILGSLISFIAIITYSQNILKRTSAIIIISIIITTLNENITIEFHPVAITFTSLYSTILVLLSIESYLPRWAIKLLIKFSKTFFKWDGVILIPDHKKFRELKTISNQN